MLVKSIFPKVIGQPLLAPLEVRLHRVYGQARYLCYLAEGLAVNQLQRYAGALLGAEQCQGAVDVNAEARVGWRGAGLQSGAPVDVESGAAGARMVAEHAAGYAEEPRGERREPAEARQAQVGLDKRVLREVVAELRVAKGLRHEEAAQPRLVPAYEPVEGAAVAEQGHAGCKFRVRGLPVHVHSCRGSSPLPASVPSRFFAAEVRAMTIWPPP